MRRSSSALAAIAALALALSACAGDRDTGFPPPSPTTASPSPTAEPGRIEVVDNTFEPAEAEVTAGTTVTWFQTGSAPHTVTFDDGSFDSHPDCTFQESAKCMQKDDEVTYEFKKAGSYPYFCRLHGTKNGVGMAGTVVVS